MRVENPNKYQHVFSWVCEVRGGNLQIQILETRLKIQQSILPKAFRVLCTHSENERSLEVLEISAGGFHSDPQRRCLRCPALRTSDWWPAVAAAGVMSHHWFCCDACQVVGCSGSGVAANPISLYLHFTTNDIFDQGRVEKCLICPTIYFYPEKTNYEKWHCWPDL